MKYLLSVLLVSVSLSVFAQDIAKITKRKLVSKNIVCQKEIDGGGSGMFSAIAVKEKSLPDYVVYRPKDISLASDREKKLPVLIWANGACMDTPIDYERMLIDVASRGYVVIALGELRQDPKERKEMNTESSMITKAIDWMCGQVQDSKSDYYGRVDVTRIAAAGHSCGGAQVLSCCSDPRLKTYIICNAGMGNMQMAGASPKSLSQLHAPILYLTGGPGDVAYKNAQIDFERIDKVPVALADMATAGHGATYSQKGGGEFGKMVLSWLDWHLKDKQANKAVFANSDLRAFPQWTMKQRNFDAKVKELVIMNGSRKIYGIASEPTNVTKKKVAIVSHGFNGTHHFAKDYFQTLNSLGYLVYTFDFPCGSVNSKSDNNTMNMSVVDEKNDLKAIVRHFQSQSDIDKDNIVLIGESQGGFVSAMAAAELKSEISKLILIYPALCIPDNWNARYKNVEDIPDTTRLWNVPMGKRFFMELRDMKVYETITQYEGPVQIIHGSKDAVVPLSYSEEAMKRYKNAHLGVIPGAGHGFTPEQRKVSNMFVKEMLSK
ncbi:MAG: alpha/beta hydrolase [Bacteroidaceae bacterium]|nr:alpha/beta hydrolase [Bacteroidaceae bacterium]